MHYVCFHYEFEQCDTDVDAECAAGGCPSVSLAGNRDKVIATARELATDAAKGAPWTNATVYDYLEALGAWLGHLGWWPVRRVGRPDTRGSRRRIRDFSESSNSCRRSRSRG
jgi:hypothetical protein